MPWLVAVEDNSAGARYRLAATCLIGRGPYNHVVLDDTRISRQHAKISPEAGGFVLYDLNSANGSYVNEATVKRYKLEPNDLVRFGPFTFRYETEASSETRRSTPPAARFVEVLTSVGLEPPAKIVGSMEVAQGLDQNPAQVGLVELEDADRKLRTLYRFLQSIASTLDTAELLDRIVAHLLEVFPKADAVVIYQQDAATGELRSKQVKRRREASSMPSLNLPPQFRDEVVRRARAILSAPVSAPAPGKAPGKRRGSNMHAPMVYGDVVHGVLHVRGPAEESPFSQSDLDMLSSMAAQAAVALQNARNHLESLRQERLRQDLELAQQIQMSFLPRQLPEAPGIEFVTEYKPAYSVGGDFYDVFWLNYDRIGVFIGDVSGKGVSAALLMARISSDLRLAATIEPDPGRALEHVNRIVLERRQTEVFVTGVYLTLDVKTREITIANAGHMAPIIRKRATGSLVRIEGGEGTAIGIFDDADYPSQKVKLEAGDTLILCTDGVFEATNLEGEQFSAVRFENSLAMGSSHPRALTKRLLSDLHAHVGEAPQSDDITILVVGVDDPVQPRAPRRDEHTAR